MGLPAKYLLDGKSNCKGNKYHLYHVDWCTKETNCVIGNGSSHKTTSSSRVILDTHIENTGIKLGRDIGNPKTPEKESETDFQNTQSDVLIDKHMERVTMSNRNTTDINP
ncbi:hypothetical protein [uncultured Methanomethylovorans sp.]|uniref:hypothetical protein n=1 Tax=uncultured Methanomethylovorans sp. TaxID=183759 RepID=UPI002AA7A899|nr:hypothetical protein [uncultured Methanomethylovorans sp.]